MIIIQIIPANKTDKGLHYSSFIKNEIENLEENGVEVHKYFFVRRLNFSDIRTTIKELKDRISEIQPDLVHAQFGSITSFITYRACAGTTPFVITFGGNDLLGHPNNGIYWRIREFIAIRLSILAAKKASAIITVSRNLFEAIPSRLKHKAKIIPRGVNTEFFRPIDKYTSRNELGWSNEEAVVLFNQSQKNAEVKNFPLAEEAFHLLTKDKNKNIRLEILLGKTIEEVLYMLNASDVLLVTSLHEGSPNIVKEAMACNLPIVSVPCGDVEERLKEVVPSKIVGYDSKDLAHALKIVLSENSRSNGRYMCKKQGLDNPSIYKRIYEVYVNAIVRGENDA